MKIDHVENLYRPKAQTILLFKRCYALEKIHGTASGLLFTPLTNTISFQSGGESHERFVSLFNQEQLLQSFKDLSISNDKTVKIFGESYAGKQQGMSHTYGPTLKFIVFDVQIGDNFLSVPDAEQVAKKLGLEFVHYVEVSTDLKELDAQRDAPSIQAVRNGVSTQENFIAGKGPKREGIVLRPLVEMTTNDNQRVICKHKGNDFKETATPRAVVDPTQLKVLNDANAVANEWVVNERLLHVLDKLPGHCMEKMRDIIMAMQEDVHREGKGEIIWSEAVAKAISKKTVEMYKAFLKSQIKT